VSDYNTLAIEEFIKKIQIAQKTNQKTVTIDIKEAGNVVTSLAIVLARAMGQLEQQSVQNVDSGPIQIEMTGGTF
jgi:uncharacterized membrane protein YdfJ with MMPL/SSD domain